LPAKQLKEAGKVVEEFASYIAESWLDFFVLNKKITTKKITKKI
jgi:hypothetical protein